MKNFRVEAVAQTEFEESAGWYESQRDGLGFEFIVEVDRVLVRIAHEEKFPGGRSPRLKGVSSGASLSIGFRTWSFSLKRTTSAE